MSGYTKLFSSILASTVWDLPATTCKVWITMMAMADQDGEVQASVPGLALLARVTREECLNALDAFMSPDPDSRSSEQEGRRIEKVEGGWRLINHAKHRNKLSPEDRKARGAARTAKYRESLRGDACDKSDKSDSGDDIRSDPEQKQNRSEKKPDMSLAPLGVPNYPAEFEAIWEGVGRRGDKEPAFRAWKKRGKPTWAQIGPVWAAYMLSESPSRGYVKDLSTWFSKGCHTQEWAPARASPGSSYQQTMSSMQGFLERHEGED